MASSPALNDPRLRHIAHEVVRHQEVASLEEAAAVRGVTPGQVIKTILVRRAEDDYLFVLVPGDRRIAWPKLRRHLGVNRAAMPDASEALSATGYRPGTITPLGSAKQWPVPANSRVSGGVSIGGGAPGVALTVAAGDLIRLLEAEVADLTDPV